MKMKNLLLIFITIFYLSDFSLSVQTCGGSHCHYWGTKPYTGNEPIPSVTMNLVFSPSAIPLTGLEKETYVVNAGTKLRLENINEFTMHCINGASRDNPLAVRVLEKKGDEFVETSGNYIVTNASVCRCDGIRNMVIGKTTNFDAYTFTSKGTYTLRIEYQKTTNASQWGVYKEINVIVGPSDVEVRAPDKSVFGLEKNVYNIQYSAEKNFRWEIINKGPLDIKILNAYDVHCATGLRENCSFPDLETMGEVNIEAGKSYLLLEKFTAKLPTTSPETAKAGLNIEFTDITNQKYNLSSGTKAVDISISFRPSASAIYPYKKTGQFNVKGGEEYAVQVCTDSPNFELYEQPAFTMNIFDDTGIQIATTGFHSINDCSNANELRVLNSEGGFARFSVSGTEEKIYSYELFGIVGIEGHYKSDFARISLSSNFDDTTQLLKKEDAIVDTSLGPQRIVFSRPQELVRNTINAFERTKPLGFFSPTLSESPENSSPITYNITDITISGPEGTFTNPNPTKLFRGGQTEVFAVQSNDSTKQGFTIFAKTAYTENEPRQLTEHDLKILWIDKENFMVGLDSRVVGLCRNLEGKLIGSQGNFASSGSNFAPHVLYEWQPNSITEDTCSSTNQNYKVCDSTQFMLSLLKRLQNIERLSSENNLVGANSKTEFSAYLMRDGFSEDFQKDWDSYYSEKFFSLDQSYIRKWKKYFSDPTKMKFSRQNNLELGRAIHEPGLYKVNLLIRFENTPWEFFDALENPKAVITINIEKIKDLEPNILYLLPFDAELGLTMDNGGKYLRKGYGLGYRGDNFIVSTGIANYSVETRDTKEESTPVAWLNSKIEKNFIDTQKNKAGNLLSIIKKSDNEYDLYFAPSTPFPAILLAKPEPNTNITSVSYSISHTARGNINAGNYLTKLVESAYKPNNEPVQCEDAQTRAKLPTIIGTDRERESNLLEPWCNVERLNVSQKIYGFTRTSADSILFETIFYPNSEGLILKNACLNAGKIYLAKLNSEGDIVGFDEIRNNSSLTFEIPVNSTKTFSDAIKQITTERACIINSSIKQGENFVPTSTGIWWNESKLIKDRRGKLESIEGISVNFCYNN